MGEEERWFALPVHSSKRSEIIMPHHASVLPIKEGYHNCSFCPCSWNITLLLYILVLLGDRHSAQVEIPDRGLCATDTGAAGSAVHGSQRMDCIIAILIFHSIYNGCVQPSP